MAPRLVCICFLIVTACLTGLTPVAGGQEAVGREFTGVKTIAILPPRIDVYEFSVGGVMKKIDDWSVRAIENVNAAVSRELEVRPEIHGFLVKEDGLTDLLRAELEETDLLYNAVQASIMRHLFGLEADYFEEKKTHFDYSLGRETQKLMAAVDAFLIIRGSDVVTTAARYALQTTAILAGAALGAVGGAPFMYIPRSGGTAWISVALVHAVTGDVLWYSFGFAGTSYTDLRDRSSTASLVNQIFFKFPIGTPHALTTPRKKLDD
jgi:hypothetical protein